MAADEKWYFTKEQLANTPSRKCGFDADKELSSRQQAANFIQDMGQRLQVTQLCINTAIVYMHRFYMFHSFTRFHRNAMAAAALFLAAKVEEQPRKLEHVIKVAQICLHREQPPLDIKSELYMEQAQELVMNENILLQTLGFDVAIDHPHTHVVRCCTLVRASKDLAQTSYFMASNSLHLTTMCLQYKPTVVACFCIHLACKWSNWEIPQSNEGKPWFWYVDKSVTQELLEQLTEEFLAIFEKCPSRLKKKIMSLSSNQHSSLLTAFNADTQAQQESKKRNGEGGTTHQNSGMPHSNAAAPSSSNNNVPSEDLKRKMEYSQRHHPDYKKAHISSHHSRIENVQNMPMKSSCMFGPPTRTQPPIPLTTNIASATTTITTSSTNNSNSNNSSSSSVSGQRLPNSHKPIPPEQRPRRPEGHHSQPYKKEYSHFFPQQPPTVEVPKPTVVPTVKVERSIFSPEVPSTPEPKPEPIMRIKEEKIEEPPPVVIPPPIKEEKVEVKQIEVKQPEPPPPPPPPPQQPVEEPHKEAKKKKKKHKEHKEHKEKHKEKHKHKKDKHKEPGPIVITIPKDKLTLPKEQPLKIKIPKDKIAPLPASPVKLKIPKDKIKESRKRDRSESPGSTSSSKRPNGAVQVTSLEFKDTSLGKSSIVGPQTPPDNFEDIHDSDLTSLRSEPSPVRSPPDHRSLQSSRLKQPLIPNPHPSKGYRYNAPYNSSSPRFRPGLGPRHHGRLPFGRGRARMRYPRHNYYQNQFHPPPQGMYQPPPMAHFQYYIPVPTFPPPPPLPDEPPPELPPPPPPE